MSDSWLTQGVRVGEVHRYEGEKLREIGIEPDADSSSPVMLRVTDVSPDTITVQSMSEKIEPALTLEEWADARDESGGRNEDLAYEVTYLWGRSRPAGAIAIANDVLLDSDSRKITRETIATLREAADSLPDVEDDAAALGRVEHYLARDLRRIADALESYLPPEPAR